MAGRKIDAMTFAKRGYEGYLRTLEEAGPLAFQLPQWEAKQWFFPWQTRLEEAYDRWQQVEKLRQVEGPPRQEDRRPEQTTQLGLMRGPAPARQKPTDMISREDPLGPAGDSSAGLPNTTISLKGSPVWQALSDALGRNEEGSVHSANRNHAILPSLWEEPTGEDASKVYRNSQFYAGRPDGVLEIRLDRREDYLTGLGLSAGLVALLVLLERLFKTRLRDKIWQMGHASELARILARIDVPHGVLMVVGLVWWFWLTPSVAGFAVVLVTSLSLARRKLLGANPKERCDTGLE